MMSQAGGMDLNVVMQRLRRLATLDTGVFDEIRGDPASTIPALGVAVFANVIAALGGWFWWRVNDIPSAGDRFVQSVVVGTILALILAAVWTAITYVLLSQMFRARVDINELVRVMAFAQAPLALVILLFIPGLDFGIGVAAMALFFGTEVIAVQTVTDAPAGRVLAATAAGFAVWSIVLGLLTTNNHTWAPGFFIMDSGSEFLKKAADAYNSLSA